MGHKLLIVLLALGAIAGFGAGFARLHYFGPHGQPWHARGHHARHAAFEDHVADVCLRAAERARRGATEQP